MSVTRSCLSYTKKIHMLELKKFEFGPNFNLIVPIESEQIALIDGQIDTRVVFIRVPFFIQIYKS